MSIGAPLAIPTSMRAPSDPLFMMKGVPPLDLITSATFSGSSVRATMHPPPPDPVSFAPYDSGSAALTSLLSSLQDTPRMESSLWSCVMRRPSVSLSPLLRALYPSRVILPISSMMSAANPFFLVYLRTFSTCGPVGALIPVLPMTNDRSGALMSVTLQVLSPRLMVQRSSCPSEMLTAIPPPWTHAEASIGDPLP